MKRSTQEEIIQLHVLITDFAYEKGWETSNLLSFLTTTFVGTMEMKGYSQNFMDQSCDRMKENFRSKRLQNGA